MNELLNNLRNNASEMEYLSIEVAASLIGKKIQTIYFGYKGQDGADEFVVGEIVSQFDLAKRWTLTDGKYANIQDRWINTMSEDELVAHKELFTIITDDGRETRIKCNKDGLFWCSDSDRHVKYRLS